MILKNLGTFILGTVQYIFCCSLKDRLQILACLFYVITLELLTEFQRPYKKDKVTGGLINLHNKELNVVFCSPIITYMNGI